MMTQSDGKHQGDGSTVFKERIVKNFCSCQQNNSTYWHRWNKDQVGGTAKLKDENTVKTGIFNNCY